MSFGIAPTSENVTELTRVEDAFTRAIVRCFSQNVGMTSKIA